MEDILFLACNFKRINIPEVERLLKDKNLLEVVKFEREGIVAGFCCIELPINDTRLNDFREIAKHFNEIPFERLDRCYSESDLDKAEFLALSFSLNGLHNPEEIQKYDFSKSCANCGAGLIPLPPLIIPQNSMRKQLMNFTAHNGWLVLRKELANEMVRTGLTGISFHSAKVGRNDTDFMWGRIDNVLDGMNEKSQFEKNNRPCYKCGKSGNFNSLTEVNEYVFKNEDLIEAMDFNLSHEFFGEWEHSRKGGAQLVIVSQRLRQFLIKEKVKNLFFYPIEIN